MSPHRAGTPGSRLSVWKYVEEHAFQPLNSTTFIKPLCLKLLIMHPPPFCIFPNTSSPLARHLM